MHSVEVTETTRLFTDFSTKYFIKRPRFASLVLTSTSVSTCNLEDVSICYLGNPIKNLTTSIARANPHILEPQPNRF